MNYHVTTMGPGIKDNQNDATENLQKRLQIIYSVFVLLKLLGCRNVNYLLEGGNRRSRLS